MTDQAARLRRLVQHGAGDSGPLGVANLPQSVPTGRVSFGPDRSAAPAPHTSQTKTRAGLQPVRLARAIAISSGKGGVGKSNLAVNLCVAFAALGKRACLIDADLGLANADLLCNLTARYTLDDVSSGRCSLGDAILDAPGGFTLLPGAAGVARMAELSQEKHDQLLQRLTVLERAMDILVIDTGAGLGRGVLSFAAAADTLLVTTTPEPTSLTDAYGLIKSITRRNTAGATIRVVMNMARTETEARDAFRRLDRVSKSFLKRPLELAGVILYDEAVRQAVHQRTPITLLAPSGRTSRSIMQIATGLIHEENSPLSSSESSATQRGFIARLKKWIARG